MNAVDQERTSFAALLEQFHAGDAGARAELYASYNEVIRMAVRRRLHHRLRQEFDSNDFTQDVWASFCRMPEGLYQFPDRQSFEWFLVRIAYNKVIEAYRRRFTTDHGRMRAQPLAPMAGSDPTPSQWAIAGERWASISTALPAPHVAIVERIREGFSQQEVADMAGISVRTVIRIVERVQRFCEGQP